LLPFPKTRDFCLHDDSPTDQVNSLIWQTCGKFIAMYLIIVF
jgi:hypothetical protein